MSTTSPQNLQPPSNGSEADPLPARAFVHLHVHTQFSPLESTIRTADLLARCKSWGMPAVAITDHGNLCGAIEFYMGAKKAGLKPILGCEVHVKLPDPPMESRSAEDKLKSSRLVLLARDLEGYKNLSRLLSRGYLEGRSGDRPLLTREWLKDYKEGLIAIPAGLKSEIAWNLLRGREANAALAFDFLLDLYGPNFYAGLDAGRLKETQIVNEWMLARAREKGVKPVAMGNVHYLDREDADSHEVLSCIKLGRTIQDSARRASSDDYWLKDAATMTEIFSETPEALDHTLEVAAACNVEFKFTNDKGHQIYHLPTFKIPEGESTENLDEFLRIEGERGLDWRFAQDAFKALQAEPTWPETELAYRTRLAEETAMIQKTGFAGYFLIVSDFIRWAKEKGVPVGPGRGSGAGSLVAWALRITDIDPIPYNLLFERFINPERISMPDFDVDFCQDRREEVIDYVKAKYGKEKVTQIITFGKLQTKNCIRDIGRVLGMPYGEVDTIAKLVPEKLGIKVKEALEAEPRLEEMCEANPIVATLFRHAVKLEGMIRNFGKHAGGVIITDKPMTEYSPLYADDDGSVMTQFNMEAAEKVGLVKFDFLGLKTLTHIQRAVELVNRRRAIEGKSVFRIEDVDVREPEPYALISRGDTLGVFQVESGGMIDLCKRIKPVNLDELTAINALYRPGPLESGMVDDFIERKHGRVPIEYPVPDLEPVLKETFGVIVYQEQVMRAARVLAGYSLGEADLLRRAMGKKKVEEMIAQKERFVAGASKQAIAPEKSGAIFDLIEKFAGYGFNKSHATAYAYISFQTAHLKHHYPAQFYAALLTMEMSDTDKLAKYIADAKEHSINVLGPDVNESERLFGVVDSGGKETIRFGLEAIKNVGAAAVDSILEERARDGHFKSLADFCARVALRKVNKKTIETLVRTGAFDTLYAHKGINRASLLGALEVAMSWGAKEQEHRLAGQGALFSFNDSDGPELGSAEPEIAVVKDWSYIEKLETERELLGFYVSGHPLDPYQSLIKKVASASIGEIQRRAAEGAFVVNPEEKWKSRGRKGEEPKLVGLLTYVREILTKKGSRMAFATLEDFSGKIEIICFPKTFDDFGANLKVGSVLVVQGNLEAQEKVAKMLASMITPLEAFKSATASPTTVLFRLEFERTTRDQLEKLRDSCTRHKGECRGVIEYMVGSEAKARMQLPDSLRFSPSFEFASEVRDIFGRDVMVIH